MLVASRAAAVLARATGGHLAAAAALLADPTAAPAPRDLLRRRYDADGAAELLTAARAGGRRGIHGVRVVADLVPAAVADARPAALLGLELAAAARPPYRDIAAQLHLFARRPA